ncbi:1-phosphatidylinositol 4,5-bisphosphate phosphodiesterase-like [Schistocerca americana]|uniref:1-phosphatidylinositol 4,5-bisphosphate phosphodiesterase-like n=1 Tax=Schistocerca americana TaxID=7009 RepID=UPI001F4F4871|nr:1-phosphatidylinositol 4,5-bisphosphate phosphodiesterase-like [Schistocerca americana]
MTKRLELEWRVPVPQPLVEGCLLDRWSEEKDAPKLEPRCFFRVDDCGFFIHWKSKGHHGNVIELSQVSDIRAGGLPKDQKLLSQLRGKHGDDVEEKSLTICSGTDYVNINYQHVICPDTDTAKVWLDGLRKITHNVKADNICPMMCLKKHWMRLRLLVNPKGKVPVRVVAKTFASGQTEKLVYKGLSELGLPHRKHASIDAADFTYDKFYALYHKICPRTDIEELFQSITQGKSCKISIEQLITFLNEKQRDQRLNEILYPLYDKRRVEKIISSYEPDERTRLENKLSKDGLIQYLMSDENAPVYLDRLDLYMDMDQPLSHYYINSSHNTYLTGFQFRGKSSVEMYRQVLLAGCRCIELDCWDGTRDDEEPIITHGRAACTDILFKDVIHAIRDTAFVTSEYPVILSLENHCSKAQQYKLARYCNDILGDMLLKEPLPDFPLEPGLPLPSPNALKKKILIKNKKLNPDVEKQELELFWQGQFVIEEDEEEEEEDTSAISEAKLDVPGYDATQENGDIPSPVKYPPSTNKIHPWLSSMVNYTQPVKFQGFYVAEENNIHYHMSSFEERDGLQYVESQAIEFVDYNKRQLSRIYPKGLRVNSSNYMPQDFWNAGCQMVSLNFQTPDTPMQLNESKFEYNARCGYLLKPDFMRRADRSFDPFAESPVDGVIAAQCLVKVISGQFLADKKVTTYVVVEMYGLPTDTIRDEFRTSKVTGNGLNPVYNAEPFLFKKVVLPELAMLRFAVYSEKGKLLGQRILPLDGLQAGYRHISLRTEANFPMSLPMLFCYIELKIYVPEHFEDLMNALSDPCAFLSAREKMVENMKAMGAEQMEMLTPETVVSDGSDGGAGDSGSDDGSRGLGSSSGGSRKSGKSSNRRSSGPATLEEHYEVMEFDAITLDSLRAEKVYQKSARRQQKELEALHRRHHRDSLAAQSEQCAAIEEVTKGRSQDELISDPQVQKVIAEQTSEWSAMLERHHREEWAMLRRHVQDQQEILHKIMENVQGSQIKQLKLKHDRELKKMYTQQAKISIETMRTVSKDKSLKKGERERTLREKQQNNTRKFVEERNVADMRQDREREKLTLKHQQQAADVNAELQNLITMIENDEIEYELGPKKEFFV